MAGSSAGAAGGGDVGAQQPPESSARQVAAEPQAAGRGAAAAAAGHGSAYNSLSSSPMAAGGLGSLASVPSSGGSAAKMLGSSPSGGGHDTPRSEDGSWVLLRRSEGWPTAEELAEQQGALARQLIGALDKLPDAAAEAVANRLVAPTARFLLQGKIFRGPRGYLQHRARMRTYWAPGFSIEIEDIDTKDSGELPGHDGKPTTRVSWTLRGRPWGVDMAVEEEAEEADAAASLIVESRGVTILSFDGHVCVGGVNSYDFQAATEEARSRRREAASAGHARRQSHRGSTPSRSEMSLGRSDSSVECSDMSVGTSDHEHCPGGDEAQSVHARGQTNALGAETAAGTSASALTSPFEIDPDEVKFGTPPVRLGIGSYGEVFRAKWRGTTVAVKRLLDQRLEAAAMDALRTELEIMSRLRHPNIVLWMGCCTRPGSAFIVTEFMNGGSLFHLLHKPPRRNLPLAARLGLALQVAQGMLYLHSLDKPLVHRDLSSNNVLIDRRGNAKITDFGLSKTMSAANDGGASYLTTTKGTGTAEYMAPEILRVGGGLPGSPAADSAVQVEYTEKVRWLSLFSFLFSCQEVDFSCCSIADATSPPSGGRLLLWRVIVGDPHQTRAVAARGARHSPGDNAAGAARRRSDGGDAADGRRRPAHERQRGGYGTGRHTARADHTLLGGGPRREAQLRGYCAATPDSSGGGGQAAAQRGCTALAIGADDAGDGPQAQRVEGCGHTQRFYAMRRALG